MSVTRDRAVKPSAVLLWIGVGSVVGVCLLVGILVMTNVAGGSADGRQERLVTDASEVTVEVFDNGYAPEHLTVRPGARVTFEFTGRLPHTVTDPNGAFDSGVLGRGDSWALTFDEPGEYHYYCVLHHAMQGVVVVAP